MARGSLARAALSAWFVALAACGSVGCTSNDSLAGSRAPLGGDGGVCALPTEGCDCQPGARSSDCFLAPIPQDDGSVLCQQGTYYCRGGAWSSCENLRSYVLPRSAALVSTGTCNPCNPDCTDTYFDPEPSDLTTTNSANVTYDPGAPGIVLAPPADPLVDTDLDGVPDIADECVGPGFRAPCDGSATNDGYYHTLPYGGATAIDPLTVPVSLKSTDLYVLMDATSSMSEEIARLKSTITSGTYDSCTGASGTGILGAIRCTMSDAEFGAGWVRDVVSAVGANDVAYHHLLDIVNGDSLVSRAVNAFNIDATPDTPEAQTEALYALASGSGFGRFVPNRASCANGGFGYACFRPAAVPVVILFTDSPFHEGRKPNSYGYTDASRSLPPMSFGSASNVLANEDVATAFDFGDLTSGASTSVMSMTAGFAAGGFQDATGCTQWDAGGILSTTNAVGGPDAVFKFLVTSTKTIAFDTTGSDFDTNLSIFRDNGDGTYTQVGCNNDRQTAPTDPNGASVFRTTSYLSSSFAAGTYFVVVDGYGGDSGAARLNVDTGTGSTATAAFPATWSSMVSALNARGMKAVSVLSCACATTAIPLGKCTDSTSSCNSTRNLCNTNCTNSETSCNGTCSSNLSSCQSGCSSTKTSCDNTCASCIPNCDTAQTSCNSSCTTRYDACTTCVAACDANNISASDKRICWAGTGSGQCSLTLPNGANVSDANAACSTQQTSCTGACSTTRTSCANTCTSNASACSGSCTTNYNSCNTGCTNTSTSCTSSCSSTRSSCVNTCTSNFYTCSGGIDCVSQQSAYDSCYSGLSSSADRTSATECYDTYVDAAALGTQTNSVDSSGTPYVYTIGTNGTGLETTVVSAMKALANGSREDVRVACEDNAATAFDECLLVAAIAPAPGGCPTAQCSGGASGSSCLGCVQGATVSYEVSFRNGVVPSATTPQTFEFAVVAYAGVQVAERVPVRIVVPPQTMGLPAQGSFRIDYNSALRCSIPPERPTWGDFTYTVSTPSTSSIVFRFSAADTLAGLSSATPVSVTVSASSNPGNPIAIDSLLPGAMKSAIYLRVVAVLNANAARDTSPVVSGWGLRYTCSPAE